MLILLELVTKNVFFYEFDNETELLIYRSLQIKIKYRSRQAKRGGRNSRPTSDEVALRLQSEIKVALYLFENHSFLANNFRFMIKMIDKTIVINGKYIRIRGKCLFKQ